MTLIVGDFKNRPAITLGDSPIETGAAARVARGVVPGDGDLEPDGVLVTVGAQFMNGLEIAGGSPFFQIFARERL